MRYVLNNFLRIVQWIAQSDASESSTPRSYLWSSSLRLLCGLVSPCESLKPPWVLRTSVYLPVSAQTRRHVGVHHLARTNSPMLCKLLRRSARSFVAFIFPFILSNSVSYVTSNSLFEQYINFLFFFNVSQI